MGNEQAIHTVFFDFGGVLAEEGFMAGLKEIARNEGKDPEAFFDAVRGIIFEIGFVTGHCSEADFWQEVKSRLDVADSGRNMRELILERFTLRPWMFEVVDAVRESGRKAAILSDQVNWLDELDARHGFFRRFDAVFNSFRFGYHKGQREFFEIACADMNVAPGNALHVDDATVNVETARRVGLHAVLYEDRASFEAEFARLVPGVLEKRGERGYQPARASSRRQT